MNKVRLLKEPGYIYDLNFIFCLNFNFNFYVEEYLSDDKKKNEHIADLKKISAQFGEISDDLYVFFHAIDTGRAFLPTFYFNPYKEQFATTYNFKFLQNELSDHDRLIRNLIKFYFHDLDDAKIETCASSFNQIFSYIKDSHYCDEEKSKLYEFFFEPSRYIHLLQYELMQKEVMLSEYYKDHYQEIIDVYNSTPYDLLIEQFKGIRDLKIYENSNENIYISYCLLNKYCFSFYYLNNAFLPVLGCEYFCLLDVVRENRKEPNLCGLGNALCEESRVKILQLLLKKEEITCKDLEKIFSFSGSTAYHHIIIMVRAGLLKTRNEGKTVLYSLNRECFDSFIKVLSIYSNAKRG